MGISKEQEEKARKQFYEDIKDVDDADVEYASKKGNKKLDQLDSNPPGALSKLWNDIKLMVNLITDYVKGALHGSALASNRSHWQVRLCISHRQ
ncbi:hypothetical protein P4S64_05055 [Vibrio sp. M60_M31a]